MTGAESRPDLKMEPMIAVNLIGMEQVEAELAGYPEAHSDL